jgi:oxygen-independent coproporphyrinogen-3 oxidase
VEANPHDVDDETTFVLSRRGVSRCSIGAQSFDRRKLAVLERDHGPADIGRAVARLRNAGIAVALDLIFSAPGEKLDDWRRDLDEAVLLEPQHISTYGLTYEKGTSYWSRRGKGQLTEASDDLQREMYAHAIDRLTAAGFEHYEISNFAQHGQRSRHNQVYWCGAPYYAAGPGASRYVGGIRETNHRSTTTWLRRMLAGESPVAERDVLAPPDRARELLVIGLRRMEGMVRDDFRLRTGFELDELAGEAIDKYVAAGLMSDDGRRVRLTREGLFVSDALWPEFL